MKALIEFLLGGCTHSRISWPQSREHESGEKVTYVCCLECGKEIRYDWEAMREIA